MTEPRMPRGDVLGMARRLTAAMHAAGVLDADEHLALGPGSKTSGVAWTVEAHSGRRGWRQPFGTFHFGFKARDCYDRLHAMSVALELVGQS